MNQVFTAASHHDVLVLLVQISVLLLTARLLGELAQRLGQPTVVGEILAGIILGPSLLSGFVPFINEWIVPQTPVQGYLLEVISLMGAMFLLLITGLETDIALIRRHARTAIGVSFGGIIFTFATGFLLGQFLPDDLLVDPENRIVFALFVATAMSISAIPVIAKVLMDLNLIRRDVGQTIIASGMSDDTIGWILLSIVAGLASGAAVTLGTVAQAVGSVLAFMVFSFTIGQWLVGRALYLTQNEIKSRDKVLSLVVICMFAWGALSQALNLEAVLGAFVLGILFSRLPNLPIEVVHRLESIALGVFTPVFFAVAGLKVNVRNLLEPRLLLIALLVILVATVGKVVGTYIGARLIGRRDHWTALSFGAGLNARGAMEIIIATIGLSLGILTQDMFSIIVVMAIVTSLMAPFALRYTLSRIQPEAQEMERLRREELNRDNLVANVHRVLLPVRRRQDDQHVAIQTIESVLLERLSRATELSVTLFNVTSSHDEAGSGQFLLNLSRQFPGQNLTRKVARGDQPVRLILDELHKDYDMLVMGASQRNRDSNTLFTPLVDQLVRFAPCPTLIVHGDRVQPDWQPRRILVPTNGTRAARRAAEVAFALAAGGAAEVFILNVLQQNSSSYVANPVSSLADRQLAVAHQFVEQLRDLGQAQDVQTFGDVETGAEIEATIIRYARQYEIDLIVLGTGIHAASDRLYLGPRVERILSEAPCPVVIVNTI
jgi:Kef-type K+ transport system membrane component KefB/nucleotide-binding universal stress UspA family protein